MISLLTRNVNGNRFGHDPIFGPYRRQLRYLVKSEHGWLGGIGIRVTAVEQAEPENPNLSNEGVSNKFLPGLSEDEAITSKAMALEWYDIRSVHGGSIYPVVAV